MIESLDSQEELHWAFTNPKSFLEVLLKGAGGQVARRLVLFKLKRYAEPSLLRQGLTWWTITAARVYDAWPSWLDDHALPTVGCPTRGFWLVAWERRTAGKFEGCMQPAERLNGPSTGVMNYL